MSFFTEYMVSYFPSRWKMSYEHSSNGYRLFRSFSSEIENSYYENSIVGHFKKLSNPIEQISFLMRIPLENKDRASLSLDYYIEPLVFGDKKRLKSVPFLKDFLYGFPDYFKEKEEIEVKDWLIWESSNPSVFNDIKEAEFLRISVNEIDSFIQQPTSGRDSSEDFLSFDDEYKITITGKDKFYREIKETFAVLNFEDIISLRKFKELDSVDWDGFYGDFKIYLTSKFSANYKEVVLEDKIGNDNNSMKSVRISLFEENGYSYLRNELLLQSVDIFDISLDKESRKKHLVDRVFLDKEKNPISIIDLVMNKKDRHLYCLSDNNTVHVYDIDLNLVTALKEEVSNNAFLNFFREIQYSGLFEEHEIGAIFNIRKAKMKKYSIKRVSPSGVESWYDNGSWIPTLIENNIDPVIWKNSSPVTVDFRNYFDEIGQWEFYITSEYEEFGTQVIGKSVLCEYLEAKKEYHFESKESFDGIFYDKAKYLCLSYGNKYKRFSEGYDTFSYSPLAEEIVLRKEYEEVEIIMPTSIGFEKEGVNYYIKLNEEPKGETLSLMKNERHVLLQNLKSNKEHPLFFSKKENREEALLDKYKVSYLVDEEEKSYAVYKDILFQGNYDKCEILFNLEEDVLYCFAENNKTEDEFRIKIIPVDSASYNRTGNYYGDI